MAEVVITEFMDDAAVASLAKEFDVLYDKTLVDQPDALAKAAADCKALIVRNRTQVRGGLLDGKNLRVVGRLGVGLDNIDCAECKKRNITVIPATGANNASVAEYVLAGMLMFARGGYNGTKAVAEGQWPREKMIGGEIGGKVLGLVGFGGIAREVAVRAQAFGMEVVAYDPFLDAASPVWGNAKVAPKELDALLGMSDFVSLHIPLTPDTKNMFDAKRLGAMKQGAVLVNTARGGIVDEAALAAALRDNKLGGAMIDVFGKEPLPKDSALADAPNCVLTPHIAGVTRESNVRVSSVIAEKIASFLRG